MTQHAEQMADDGWSIRASTECFGFIHHATELPDDLHAAAQHLFVLFCCWEIAWLPQKRAAARQRPTCKLANHEMTKSSRSYFFSCRAVCYPQSSISRLLASLLRLPSPRPIRHDHLPQLLLKQAEGLVRTGWPGDRD